MNLIRKIIYKLRLDFALEDIRRLEKQRNFIRPFFCGETNYPRDLEKWKKKKVKAEARLERIQQVLKEKK